MYNKEYKRAVEFVIGVLEDVIYDYENHPKDKAVDREIALNIISELDTIKASIETSALDESEQ